MSQTIPQAYYRTYSSNVYMLVQQHGSKLRGTVMEEPLRGEAYFVERVAPVVATEKVNRHAPTPRTDTQHSSRGVFSRTFQWADAIDPTDMIRILIDPQSSYSQSAMYALGRSIDDVIIAAFDGPALSSKTASTFTVFDTANEIDLGVGGPFTLDAVRMAAQIFDDNDVDEMGRMIGLHPRAKHQLLLNTEVTSADFATVKALVKGDINSFYGFDFVWSTRFSTGTTATGFFWQKMGVHLGMGQEVRTYIDRLPTMQQETQIYASMDVGAVRLEEAKVGRFVYDTTVSLSA